MFSKALLVGAFLFSNLAGATADYWQMAIDQGNRLSGKTDVKVECKYCHIKGPGSSRNAFGLDFEALNDWTNPDEWAYLMSLDSNGNGLSNLQDIVDETNPGI